MAVQTDVNKSLAIYNRLKDIRDNKTVSFHMPGHKNGKIFDRLGYSDIMKELYKLDTTEIIGTDNLHSPKDVIKFSQDNIKNILYPQLDCDVKMLVNGSTCGIEAAIMTVCKSKDKIILNRGCHQSAYNGCVLSDAIPIFVKEYVDYDNNIFLGARQEDYIDAIENNKDAKAVVITRPTYYGMSFEIDEIIKKAHEHNMVVIVDEAHGAHFGLNEEFPKLALYYGADVVIQSCHKTLPAFTQSSIMILNNENNLVDRAKLDRILNMTESSSPSYVMMMSIEICYDIYKKHGRVLMLELLDEIKRFKKCLKNYKVFKTDDPTKIFINTIDKGINGYDFAKVLRYRYNIQVELSNYCGVLLLCTIGNDETDFEAILDALGEISDKKLFGLNLNFFDDVDDANRKKKNDRIKRLTTSKKIDLKLPYDIPKMMYEPSVAYNMETESIDLKEACGRVGGEFVIPYPPGVCLLSPGEVISQDVLDYLEQAREMSIDINGMESLEFNKIKVIK